MKTISLISFLSFFSLIVTPKVLAQQGIDSHSISVGVGKVSSEVFFDASVDIVRGLAVVTSLGYFNSGIINRNYGPTFHITYQQAITEEFSIGLGAAYEKASGDYKQKDKILGHFVKQSYTLAAEGKYLYRNKKSVSLYATMGLGFTQIKQKTQKPADWNEYGIEKRHFNGHVTPIGIRVGRKLAAFAEAGFGYKGLLNLGLDYRF